MVHKGTIVIDGNTIPVAVKSMRSSGELHHTISAIMSQWYLMGFLVANELLHLI